jgi:predicted RecB family nuclease
MDLSGQKKYTPEEQFSPLIKELMNEGNYIEQRITNKLLKGVVNKAILKSAKKETYESDIKKNVERTVKAMERGKDIIIQGHLSSDGYLGIPDILVKVPGKSKFGDYHYAVKDIKRARAAKGEFILQICFYSELLSKVQDVLPENAYVILGDGSEEIFPTKNYYQYYKHIKKKFQKEVSLLDENKIPIPSLDDLGKYNESAKNFLVETDDLRLIPTITIPEIKEYHKKGVSTLTEFNKLEVKDDRDNKLKTMLQARKEQKVIVLDHDQNDPKGLNELPTFNSNLDVFFKVFKSENLDKEPFLYLYKIGFYENDELIEKTIYAYSKKNEEYALKQSIDFIKDRVLKGGSIYFYGEDTYINLLETASFYDTYLQFITDNFFRNKFIDLKLILEQSLALPTDSYSLKNVIELFEGKIEDEAIGSVFSLYLHGRQEKRDLMGKRLEELSKRELESIIKIRQVLEKYQLENDLNYIPITERDWYEEKDSENKEEKVIKDIYHKKFYEEANITEKTYILIRQLTKFHEVEKKPKGIEMQQLYKSKEIEWKKSTRCLSSLRRIDINLEKRLVTYKINPEEATKVSKGDSFMAYQNRNLRGIVIFKENDTIVAKLTIKGMKIAEKLHRISIMESNFIQDKTLVDSIRRVAQSLNKDDPTLGIKKCIFDFFQRKVSFKNLKGDIYQEESLIEDSCRAVADLDSSCLVIQGPPGAGKTYTSAQIIFKLLAEGKRIGITSNSHKAINNLMGNLYELNKSLKMVKFNSKPEDIEFQQTQKLKSLDGLQIIGATAFKWAKEDMIDSIDYLFIDEAGQVSLANLLAMSNATKNIILIGDQMQLEQPVQAIHPGDSGKSALEYYLQGEKTIAKDKGIFLPITRRMNKELTEVVSNYFYEGKLSSHDSAQNRSVILSEGLVKKEKGVQFISCNHEGNQQSSQEEVEKIQEIVTQLKKSQVNIDGSIRNITSRDIIIVSPYNMQVNRLKKAFEGYKIGSVDLFQGQEAPIVIFSMGASEGGSRGISFLLNENRLNVALSRGKALAIIVGSENVLKSKTSSMEDIKLLNMMAEIINNHS